MTKSMIAFLAAAFALFAVNAADAATAGARRTISTAGLTQYNVGNGASIFTNTPDAVKSFSYNTGSATGTITGLTVGQ